jgi:chromosome segregation ATPase
MSLTKQDLADVRSVMISAITELVLPRFDELSQQITSLELAQQETSRRLTALEHSFVDLEGKVDGLKNYVIEIYAMLTKFERRYDAAIQKDHQLQRRIQNIELFVQKAARQLGIKFKIS